MRETQKNRILYVTDHDAINGNYFRKVLEAAKKNPPRPGTVNHVSVAHDDWCNLLSGKGPCNCDPEVTILGVEQ